MIIEALVSMFLTMANGILSVLPDLPALDTPIQNAGNWVITLLNDFASVPIMIYGGQLFTAICAMLVIYYAYEFVYKLTIWFMRKIPFVNMS